MARVPAFKRSIEEGLTGGADGSWQSWGHCWLHRDMHDRGLECYTAILDVMFVQPLHAGKPHLTQEEYWALVERAILDDYIKGKTTL